MHTMYSLLGNQWDAGPAARRQDRLSGATANGRGSADPVGGNLLSGKPSNKETGLSDMNFQAKLENNWKQQYSSIQATVPQASHLSKASHLPHLQSLQEFCFWSSWHYTQLLRSWCGHGSLGIPSRWRFWFEGPRWRGGGAETALPDKLPDDTNAAGLSKKGLEMSVGWAGWSAKSQPPNVHCLVLSQASLFECAISSAYSSSFLFRKLLFAIDILAWAMSHP